MLGWLILSVAIVAEVVGALSIGLSKGFTVRPTLALGVMIPSYTVSFVCLTLLMRWELMNLSVAYAIWVGLGVALTAVLSAVLGHEPLSPVKIAFLILIVIGAAGLDLVG